MRGLDPRIHLKKSALKAAETMPSGATLRHCFIFNCQTAGRHDSAFPRRESVRVLPESRPLKERGRGECRVQAAPMARLQQKKQAAVTTGSARTSGIPRAMVLTAASCSPWCAGLVSHHRLADHHPRLDPSVGESGPHDLAVRTTSHVRRCDTSIASRAQHS